MSKFKKIFVNQLVFLPLVIVITIIIGVTIHQINRNSYKEISKEEFTKIAINNGFTSFTSFHLYYEMKTETGEKYCHEFKDFGELQEFEKTILRNSGSYENLSKVSFYGIVLPAIIIGIILLDILVLWFVAFHDLLKSEFTENHNKWIWFIGLLLIPFIVPFFYFSISKNQKRK